MKKILIPILLGFFLGMFSLVFIAYEEDISYHFFNSYDTEIPSYILMVFFIVVIVFIVIYTSSDLLKIFRGNKERKRLIAQGRDAHAKVISLDEASDGTITTINDQPLVTVELELSDENDKPYKVKVETLISRLEIPKLQPGNIVDVKVDPKDKNNVIII